MFQDNTPPQNEPAPETPQAQPESQEQKSEQPKPADQKPVTPAVPPVKTSQEERMWAAIGYIAFMGVISLAMKPKSDFVKKHAAQGLVIFGVWFVGLIIMIFPVIYMVGGIIALAAMGLAVFGIYQGIRSYEMKLPVLSDIATKIPVDTIIGTVTGKTPEPKAKTETPAEPQQEVPEAPAEEAPAAPEVPTEPTPPAEEPPAAPEAPTEPTPPAEEPPAAPEVPETPVEEPKEEPKVDETPAPQPPEEPSESEKPEEPPTTSQ